MASAQRPANGEVITKIETVFENIADSLLREETISIPLKYKKPTPTASNQSNDSLPTELTNVSFPSKTPGEARRFTVLFRILELIHEALSDGTVVSKRNIYYKDPALFKSQAVVDKYVDIFAYTFGVQRAALNVTAAAKGLVAGDFTLMRIDGTAVHREPEVPNLIDDIHEIRAVDISHVSWILIVEKEATFRTLASSNLHRHSLAGKGIILTAKGYPDLSTRSFLRLLSTSHAPTSQLTPIYALTDFDPDGIAIMSTYKHGSLRLSHENAHLIVPSIHWLGIQSSDVLDESDGQEGNGLLRLTRRDRKKAAKMLEWDVLREEGLEGGWRREVQVMLMLGFKAEMEILGAKDGGVEGWVEGKLLERSRGF